ncbi:MAG TPA: tellurite resistance/C4-dicarboxylate transporter family protein [Stellaceae bacterium]
MGIGRLAALPSSSFAAVMATGIVSIAASELGLGRLALALLAVNIVLFVTLWGLNLARLARFPAAVSADLRAHRRAPGFLTLVAGTNVLGEQIAVLAGEPRVAAALWLCALLLWLGLVYGFFALAATRPEKPALAEGIDGGTLLVTVATQSAAILGVQLLPAFAAAPPVLFLSLALWLLGGALYFIFIVLILYRWLFQPMAPADLVPNYWINMGAAAISALAGARLAPALGAAPMLAALRGYVVAETMLFWALASWWIPLLVVVMSWRHLKGGLLLSPPFQYWAMVFPLGMYAAATFNFLPLVGAEFLAPLPRCFFWLAFAAWCGTAVASVGQCVRQPR